MRIWRKLHVFLLARVLVLVAVLLHPVYTLAEGRRAHVIPLPNHGQIRLTVPATWRSRVEQPPGNLPPTIFFSPEAGSGFEVLVTAVWPFGPGAKPPTREQARGLAEKSAEAAKAQAVEQQVALKELRGPSADGYFFSTTDRAPKPGDFNYLTQGVFVLGDLLVTFTALAKAGSEAALWDAVSAMRGATYDATGSPAARETASEKGKPVKVAERKSDYLVTQPGSPLGLRIPKGGLRLQASGGEGADWNPSYFALKDTASDLMFSGWFSSEEKYPGLARKWLGETHAWPSLGLPEPRDPSFGWLNGWETVFYDVAVPGGISSHLRAHWTQSGTWIDVHISITAAESSSALRARLKTLLWSLEVVEKK